MQHTKYCTAKKLLSLKHIIVLLEGYDYYQHSISGLLIAIVCACNWREPERATQLSYNIIQESCCSYVLLEYVCICRMLSMCCICVLNLWSSQCTI